MMSLCKFKQPMSFFLLLANGLTLLYTPLSASSSDNLMRSTASGFYQEPSEQQDPFFFSAHEANLAPSPMLEPTPSSRLTRATAASPSLAPAAAFAPEASSNQPLRKPVSLADPLTDSDPIHNMPRDDAFAQRPVPPADSFSSGVSVVSANTTIDLSYQQFDVKICTFKVSSNHLDGFTIKCSFLNNGQLIRPSMDEQTEQIIPLSNFRLIPTGSGSLGEDLLPPTSSSHPLMKHTSGAYFLCESGLRNLQNQGSASQNCLTQDYELDLVADIRNPPVSLRGNYSESLSIELSAINSQ